MKKFLTILWIILAIVLFPVVGIMSVMTGIGNVLAGPVFSVAAFFGFGLVSLIYLFLLIVVYFIVLLYLISNQQNPHTRKNLKILMYCSLILGFVFIYIPYSYLSLFLFI
jgi:hypothetical protein